VRLVCDDHDMAAKTPYYFELFASVGGACKSFSKPDVHAMEDLAVVPCTLNMSVSRYFSSMSGSAARLGTFVGIVF